jgi:tRNA(Arg) A34 adenosine deaminase TadA
MCSGVIYWSGVGRVVYALSEEGLLALTQGNPQNDFLYLHCREVFAHGNRTVEVLGPLLEDEARAVHEGFWIKDKAY